MVDSEHVRMCGKNFSLKPGWSPIQEIVTPDGAGTRNTFVTEPNIMPPQVTL